MKINKLIILLSILLTSCSYKVYEGDFSFEEKYYNIETNNLVYDEDYSLISKALANKESFGVYVFLSGCSTCESFKPYVEQMLVSYKISIYSVNYQIMKYSEDSYHDLIKYAPSIMLFNKGELVDYLDPNDNKDTYAFKSTEGLISWFSKYVDLDYYTKEEENSNI